MVFLQSYSVLRLARCKPNEITNFIFRNISKSSKSNKRIPVNILNDNALNKIPKFHLSENVTSNDIGYVERLKSDVSVKNDADNKNVTYNVDFVETNTQKQNDALEEFDEKLPGPLDPCDEDLSHIGPNVTATYNFAKFADKSNTIQQLVKLGVELYKLEKDRDVVEMFLSLDFDNDMKPYIQFLHDCGVNPENLGYFITRNPKIFKEDMDDLRTRIRYLRAHEFTPDMIQRIVNANPPWLSFSTQDMDKRLGYFQTTFKLTGDKVRNLAVKCPRLITYDMKRIQHTTFAVKEQMGFNLEETHLILFQAPRVWIRARSEVVKTFDYAHNKMKLSHSIISQEPKILLCRKTRLERRHEFLVQLQRNQYDPSKPLYVSPDAIIKSSDVDFCKNVAKASIHTYNLFFKCF